MKKQLISALGMMAMALSLGSGCLVVSGDDDHRPQGCVEDCHEYEVCQTYCDAWECWDECWYETECEVFCPAPAPATPVTPSTPSSPPANGDACLCDIDCASGDVCISDRCVEKADNNKNATAGLCQACESTNDCVEDDARCIRLNYEQSDKQGEKVCSRTCEVDSDCPISFECVNVSQEVGVPAQCLPKIDAGASTRTCTNDASLECVKAKDCGVGESCVNNVCTAPSSAECTSASDCGSGEACRSFKCVAMETPECVDRSDCAASEICIDAKCTPQSTSCVFNSECDGGKCVDGACTASCQEHADCGPYERCRVPQGATNGLCEPVECRRSADCSAGQLCVDANCEQGCTTDAECGAGFVCGDNGYCKQDPNIECRSTSECAQDELCESGECKPACTCNQDCASGQVCNLTTNVCDTITGGSGQPVEIQCANSCDCPSGQSCTENVCG